MRYDDRFKVIPEHNLKQNSPCPLEEKGKSMMNKSPLIDNS